MTGTDVARTGAAIGLTLAGLFGVALIAVQLTRDDDAGGVMFGVAFSVIYVAPYLGALLATRIRDADLRIAVWVAAVVLSLLLSASSLTGAALPLLLPGGIILAGAWRTHRETCCRPPRRAVALSAGIVLVGIASTVVLLIGGGPDHAALSTAAWALTLIGIGRLAQPGAAA